MNEIEPVRPAPPVEPPLGPEVVVGEVVGTMPARKELVLAGRAAMVDLGIDPDELVDARTEQQLRRATPENTIAALRWGFGFLIRYCGMTGRKHDPPTVGTIRKMICDSFYIVTKAGKGPGRYGQPYAPKTIELVVYVVSMICDRMQWVNPVRHPLVSDQLAGYREDYVDAGYRTDEADALSNGQNVALARHHDLATVQGLRAAAMLRGQFDLGCRADEWCKVQGEDLKWLDGNRVLVTFRRTKGRKERTVAMEALPDEADYDVDPVRLLSLYVSARLSAGWDGRGPLWVEVRRGDRRNDWEETRLLAGRFLDGVQMGYQAYAKVFNRTVTATGIALDPNPNVPMDKKRTVFHFTTHSNRIGMINEAVRRRYRLEDIAPRTGHSPASPIIHKYLRAVPQWGDFNPGVGIRKDIVLQSAQGA